MVEEGKRSSRSRTTRLSSAAPIYKMSSTMTCLYLALAVDGKLNKWTCQKRARDNADLIAIILTFWDVAVPLRKFLQAARNPNSSHKAPGTMQHFTHKKYTRNIDQIWL